MNDPKRLARNIDQPTLMSTTDIQLYEYALDILPEPERADVETALQSDGALRNELKAIREALAVLSEARSATADTRGNEPIEPAPALRDSVVSSLQAGSRYGGFARRLGRLFDLGASEVARLLEQIDAAPAAPWKPLPMPGCLMLPVRGGARMKGAQCALIHVERGAAVPPHGHDAEEHMLILDGYAAESSGRHVGPGDEVISAADSAHGFEILVDQPCVFAVINHEPGSQSLSSSRDRDDSGV